MKSKENQLAKVMVSCVELIILVIIANIIM